MKQVLKISIIALSVLSQWPTQGQANSQVEQLVAQYKDHADVKTIKDQVMALEPQYGTLTQAYGTLSSKDRETIVGIITMPLSVSQILAIRSLMKIAPGIITRFQEGNGLSVPTSKADANTLYKALEQALDDCALVPQDLKEKALVIGQEEGATVKKLISRYLTASEITILVKTIQSRALQTLLNHFTTNQAIALEKLPEAIKEHVKALILDMQGIFATLETVYYRNV